MTEEMRAKLSCFIDDLIEHRLNQLEIDIYADKKKKLQYYSIDIDTKITCRTNNTFGLSILTQRVHFCVCPQTGFILLTRDDFDEYRDEDIEFTKKYSEIIQSVYLKKQKDSLYDIVDSSYVDLKLQRDSNIRKLIG